MLNRLISLLLQLSINCNYHKMIAYNDTQIPSNSFYLSISLTFRLLLVMAFREGKLCEEICCKVFYFQAVSKRNS